jgi:serine/threonine protein kinase
MPAPTTIDALLDLVRKSGVVPPRRLETVLDSFPADSSQPEGPRALADLLMRSGLLTAFQAEQLLLGKWRGFLFGKYRLLEPLGAGGMGSVFLCEHQTMRRRVAVKFLPVALAKDAWFLERFHREAQAAAALDHPNIVHAFDLDRDGDHYFLVMEYVDGANLQAIVDRHGPLSVPRAAHYLRQAAQGLQHLHEKGLVHRDIKPANILLDRQGAIKLLDLGLARSLRDHASDGQSDPPAAKNLLGTEDYLAPEQIVNSDDVDIRADLYSLGATLYFLLAGKPPFPDSCKGCQKLLWHLARQPKPIRESRPEVPKEFAALLEKLMAKNPWQRYQTPAAVVEALFPWTREPIPAPPEVEMPRASVKGRSSAVRADQGVPLSSATPKGRAWVVTTEAKAAVSLVDPPSDLSVAAPTSTAVVQQRTGDTHTDVHLVPPGDPAARTPVNPAQ